MRLYCVSIVSVPPGSRGVRNYVVVNASDRKPIIDQEHLHQFYRRTWTEVIEAVENRSLRAELLPVWQSRAVVRDVSEHIREVVRESTLGLEDSWVNEWETWITPEDFRLLASRYWDHFTDDALIEILARRRAVA
jgi:hypothetical protein